jgi:hypothetical protein
MMLNDQWQTRSAEAAENPGLGGDWATGQHAQAASESESALAGNRDVK